MNGTLPERNPEEPATIWLLSGLPPAIPNGIAVGDDGNIALICNGTGLAIQLTAAELRSFGERVLDVASRLEQPVPIRVVSQAGHA